MVESAGSGAPKGQRFAVQDVSFELKAGMGLGIIGPSASGKSSLARMLVGVWPTWRGKIRLDGAALEQWLPEELGQHIGYLPQDVELFAGTVAQNIARFHRRSEARERVIRAAMAADVHEMILRLPQGYETQVGEGGASLSGGQRQRIGLARALYGNPFLVVLDEPNSNLDNEGEHALTRAIQGVRERGGIAIVIAHRPSALAGVDHILVLDEGTVRKFGTKEEVLSSVLRPVPASNVNQRQHGQVRLSPGSSVMNVNIQSKARQSINRHTRLALGGVALLVFGLGGWAWTTELSGAVVAPGTIVVDSHVKKVQHPTGGVIGEILARDGDRVRAGDVVIRLDETVARANLSMVSKSIDEMTARRARLEAERDGAKTIRFPADLTTRAEDLEVGELMSGERKLFDSRREARAGQKSQLQERVAQLAEQIDGTKLQASAKADEIDLIASELTACRNCGRRTSFRSPA